ncbi:hypothetical protein ACLOJK_020161 [Asimina triloba]
MAKPFAICTTSTLIFSKSSPKSLAWSEKLRLRSVVISLFFPTSEETVRDPFVDGAITVRDPSDEKLMYKAVLQLDEMHELYEKLLWDAEQRLLKVYDSVATGEGRHLREDIQFYSTPLLPIFALPVSGCLTNPEDEPAPDAHSSCVIDVGISLDLFHSMLISGKFWIWGKGDGGHLGLSHENSVFILTENHNINGLRSITLGGIHSAALTTHDNVFTSWSSSSISPSYLKGLSRAFSQLL